MRPADSDEINVSDVVSLLKREKWLILALTCACALAAGLASLLVTRTYEATIAVSPVAEEIGGGRLGSLGSSLSQLSGLASLAGLAGGDSRRAESLATLQSEMLARQFLQNNHLLPVLYAQQWDAGRGAWKPAAPKKLPTLWKGVQLLKKRIVKVTENTKTGIVTLTVSWTDPAVAAQWANELVQLANSYLRSKAIAESERNIDYLKEQVAKTTDVELQRTIYSLMESEIKKQMVARGSDEYALKVIDPATAPEIAASPQPLLYVLGGAFLGLVLSFLIMLFRRPAPPRAAGAH